MARQTPDILAGLGQPSDDALGLAMGPQVQTLAHAQVRRDGGTQPRAEISNDLVGEYAEAMAAGAVFPPVIVYFDGSDYWLADGFHRMAAWASLTRPVLAEVRQGTRRDAVLYSVGANAAHGQRRTNADKRRAVMALLEDQEWRKWSDREIARRCAVSNQFVSNVRAELTVNGGQSTERRGADGRVINVQHIGKRTPAPAVAAQGGKYITVAELQAALLEWSEAFEDRVVALDGLRTDWMNGQGSYMDDWENAAPAPWQPQDLLAAMRLIKEEWARWPRFTGTSSEEETETLAERLARWCETAGGQAALNEMLAETTVRGFPMVGQFPRWVAFKRWYGDEPLSSLAVRDVLREMATMPRPETPAATPETAGPVIRGREMEFERKVINQGKTVKVYGRNVDGTLTVTIDAKMVHLYSPGVTMTNADAVTLLSMIRTAQQVLFDPEEMMDHA